MNRGDFALIEARAMPCLLCSLQHGSERQSFGLIMSKNTRVHHERGFTMKRGSAEKGVRAGNLKWNKDGSIRDATAEEIFDWIPVRAAALDKIARTLAPLEIPGTHYKPTTLGMLARTQIKKLLMDAEQFAWKAA